MLPSDPPRHAAPAAPASSANGEAFSGALPPRLTRGVSDGGFLSAPTRPKMMAKRVSSANDVGKEVVLARSSVPYSDEFPIRDQQVGPHHFRTLKMLGRGGIGRVFLVQLKGTSLLYAMKVLTKDEMIQRNKVKRVMTEREILATANHPFVVTMYASFQTADRLCFVMEYCAGGEFFKVLQRQPKRRLKEDAVRFYAAEVTLALEYLHHTGVIYRDLKPENILLRANGHLALTDFDLSKQAHAVSPRVIQQQLSMSDKIKRSFSLKRNNSSLQNLEIVDSEPILPYQTNSFVGTEDYISPEIINGVAQSSAVDWWTLGVLIYEMLCGTTPFKGGHADETFNNIVTHQVKWPDDVTVSADCKHLVKRLLRREPDKRLGAENGASDIKRAKWFSTLNFALIRNETPPIIPKIRNPLDFSQYAGIAPEDDDSAATVGPIDARQSGDFDNENPDNPFLHFNIRRQDISHRKY
jgi:protein-serine/threonine kinase